MKSRFRLLPMTLLTIALANLAHSATAQTVPPCALDTLCLAGGRFEITVEWQTSTDSGSGHPVVLTESAGYFWFFDPANIEVLVQVVDACADYGQEWVFAAGLTDLGVTMKVKNTHTGIYKTYSNPKGTPFQPIQDAATSLILGCSPSQPSETRPADRRSK